MAYERETWLYDIQTQGLGELQKIRQAVEGLHGAQSSHNQESVKSQSIYAQTSKAIMGQVTSLAAMAGAYLTVRAAAEGAWNMVSKVVQIGAEFEYLGKAIDITTGIAGKGAQEMSRYFEMARGSPFSAQEIIRAEKLMNAFGITGEGALKKMIDGAAIFEGGLDGMVMALERASMGQMRGLQRMGIGLRDVQAELGHTIDTMSEMGQAETVSAVLDIIERRFPNAAERMDDTVKGAFGDISDYLTEFANRVAQQGPLQLIKRDIDALTGAMAQAGTPGSAVDQFGNTLVDVFVRVEAAAWVTAESIVDAFSTGKISEFLDEIKTYGVLFGVGTVGGGVVAGLAGGPGAIGIGTRIGGPAAVAGAVGAKRAWPSFKEYAEAMVTGKTMGELFGPSPGSTPPSPMLQADIDFFTSLGLPPPTPEEAKDWHSRYRARIAENERTIAEARAEVAATGGAGPGGAGIGGGAGQPSLYDATMGGSAFGYGLRRGPAMQQEGPLSMVPLPDQTGHLERTNELLNETIGLSVSFADQWTSALEVTRMQFELMGTTGEGVFRGIAGASGGAYQGMARASQLFFEGNLKQERFMARVVEASAREGLAGFLDVLKQRAQAKAAETAWDAAVQFWHGNFASAAGLTAASIGYAALGGVAGGAAASVRAEAQERLNGLEKEQATVSGGSPPPGSATPSRGGSSVRYGGGALTPQQVTIVVTYQHYGMAYYGSGGPDDLVRELAPAINRGMDSGLIGATRT